MLDMVYREILPAALKYTKSLSDTVLSKKSVSQDLDCSAEEFIIRKLSPLTSELVRETEILRDELAKTKDFTDIAKKAEYYCTHVVTAMERVRAAVDGIEPLMAEEYLPYPTYGKILFSVM